MTRRCSECGHPISEETERERLHRNVFVWTSMTIFFWGSFLIGYPYSQWTITGWEREGLLLLPLVVLPVSAIYFWVQFLRGRRSRIQRTERCWGQA
jgi:hypothetical protein